MLHSTHSFLHIHNRGVDGGPLFFGDEDYHLFLRLMADYLPGDDIALLAYTLLPTEYRLIVQQNEQYAVSGYVQRVCWNYARSINHRRKRTGHLFEGRFKMEEAENESSLLRLSHSLLWSPVTTGLVRGINDWKFSSIGKCATEPRAGFITLEPFLSIVGGREEYMRFLQEYDPSQPGSIPGFFL